MTDIVKPKRIEHTPKIYAADSVYVDPLDCDSTISYKVIGQKSYMEGNVTFADCSHKIDWLFKNSQDSVEKIDIAINMLTDFRKALLKAQKDYKDRKDEE